MSLFGKKESPGNRRTSYERKSKETEIEIPLLDVDGKGEAKVSTTIGFLDHMLTLFAYHGFFDLQINAKGDTHVDNHHLNEDVGLALGEAFKKALGDCRGINRSASAEVPMDMACAKVLVDISNRPAFKFTDKGGARSEEIKDEEGYSMDDGEDFLRSFATKLCMNLHIDISGEGDMHHFLEAVFKALGVAMDRATSIDPRREGEIPSSKGIL